MGSSSCFDELWASSIGSLLSGFGHPFGAIVTYRRSYFILITYRCYCVFLHAFGLVIFSDYGAMVKLLSKRWWIPIGARPHRPKPEAEVPRAEVGFPTADQEFSSTQDTLFGF